MARKSSEFDLGPHWHQDFRDVTTLPEDRLVRVRFLANTCAAVVALCLLIVVGWQLSVRHYLSAQLRYWDNEIAVRRDEYDELQLLLRDYITESTRINEAYKIVYSPVVVSDLIVSFGRTLPERMAIDMIEHTGQVILMRGYLAEPPERASRVLGQFLETLRNDPRIGPLFSDISAPGFGRPERGDEFLFELQLKLR